MELLKSRTLSIDNAGIGYKVTEETGCWAEVLGAVPKASNVKLAWSFVQKGAELRAAGLALVCARQFIIPKGSSIDV